MQNAYVIGETDEQSAYFRGGADEQIAYRTGGTDEQSTYIREWNRQAEHLFWVGGTDK